MCRIIDYLCLLRIVFVSCLHILHLQAKNSGNKETIRRGALMKMLLNCAQTLPLWIGNPGEKPPPLCGAIPPEPNYVAKVLLST